MSQIKEEALTQKERDSVFSTLRKVGTNNMCFDCDKKNPKWASIHLGLFLCLDCAGKHRQYGVMYSFVKSINLDVWNNKQIKFMEKGGNSKALDYFQRKGFQKAIDYKSGACQRYKEMLTKDVEIEFYGKVAVEQKQTKKQNTKVIKEQKESVLEIGNAEKVTIKQEKGKKKGKKKIGQKVNVNFNQMNFDDGVDRKLEQMIQQQEEKSDKLQRQDQQTQKQGQEAKVQQIKIQPPKELTMEESLQKLSTLKTSTNISSESFKSDILNEKKASVKLNELSNARAISSSDFQNAEEQDNNETMSKIKNIVSNAGEKIGGTIYDKGQKVYERLSSYWKK